WDLVSVWLAELERFNSPLEFFEQTMNGKASAPPTHQLLEQAKQRLHGAKYARPDRRVDVEISRSLSQVGFLETLFWALNTELDHLVNDSNARIATACEIVDMLDLFYCSDARAAEDASMEGLKAHAAKAWAVLCEVLVNLRAANRALESISRRFFH